MLRPPQSAFDLAKMLLPPLNLYSTYLAVNLSPHLAKVLRLPRNMYLTLRGSKMLSLPRDLHLSLCFFFSLPLSLSLFPFDLSIHLSSYHLSLRKCCACHEICTRPCENAAPATKSATKSAPQVAKVLRLPRGLHLRNSLRGRASGQLFKPVANPWQDRAQNRGTVRVVHARGEFHFS